MTKIYYKKRAGFTPKQMLALGENFVLGFQKGTEKTIDVLPHIGAGGKYCLYYNERLIQVIKNIFDETEHILRATDDSERIRDVLRGACDDILEMLDLFKIKTKEIGGWCEQKDYIEKAEAKIGKFPLEITDILCDFTNLEFVIRGMLHGEKES